MRAGERAGISRVVAACVLVGIVAVAAVAVYLATAPSGRPTTTQSSPTSASSGLSSVAVTMVPSSPLISPGQTQNYSQILVTSPGQGGTLAVKAFAPNGLSVVPEQSSVVLSAASETIPVVLRADASLSPGDYQVSVESSSQGLSPHNQTFTVDVVPMLVTIQYEAYHPQNITVTKGTQVTWINLDSAIGCCDPGYHTVTFLSGGNATSPVLKRFDTWSHTFGADGVVDYYCSIHPFMKGQVTVTG